MPRNKRSSAASMNQLVQALQKLVVQPGPSKTKKRKNRRRKKGSTRSMGASEGELRMERRELLTTVKLTAGMSRMKGHIDLYPDNFTFLKNIAGSFDRSRWESVHLYYKPAVGTTYGGLVSLGVDWDFNTKDVVRESVSACTPTMTCAAWADTEQRPMVLPVPRLQSRTWYMHRATELVDRGPARILIAADGTSSNTEQILGEIWVQYRVVMQGTNPA